MPRFNDHLIGWGTAIGSFLTALSLSVTLIAYQVHMAEGINHCTRAVDDHEIRLRSIGSDVGKIREDVAYMRGHFEPPPKSDLQASK
jgi:hypothetical protein